MAARTDRTSDPELRAELLVARQGQAFYNRALNQLRDDEFDSPSAVVGWSRRRLIAEVGLRARQLAVLAEEAGTHDTPLLEPADTQFDLDVEFATTLPVQALRNLNDHAAVHLSVAWRDLDDAGWNRKIQGAGQAYSLKQTVTDRAAEVWLRALDLAGSAAPLKLPSNITVRFQALEDVSGVSGS